MAPLMDQKKFMLLCSAVTMFGGFLAIVLMEVYFSSYHHNEYRKRKFGGKTVKFPVKVYRQKGSWDHFNGMGVYLNFLSGVAVTVITVVVSNVKNFQSRQGLSKLVKLAPLLFAVGTFFTIISWLWIFIATASGNPPHLKNLPRPSKSQLELMDKACLEADDYLFLYSGWPVIMGFSFFFQVVEMIGALGGLVGLLLFGFGGLERIGKWGLQSGPPSHSDTNLDHSEPPPNSASNPPQYQNPSSEPPSHPPPPPPTQLQEDGQEILRAGEFRETHQPNNPSHGQENAAYVP